MDTDEVKPVSDPLEVDAIDTLFPFRIDWVRLSKRRKDMNGLFSHMRTIGLQIIN